MLIGKRSQFAIEYELDEDYGGYMLFGKFCLWMHNFRIGNYKLKTSLYNVVSIMDYYLIKNSGNRINNELFDLEKNELYTRLNEAIYGFEDSIYDEIAIKEDWARFDIKLPINVIDGWKMFVVENEEQSRIIVYDMDNSKLQEFKLITGQFDRIVKQFYNELNCLLELELEKMQNNIKENPT